MSQVIGIMVTGVRIADGTGKVRRELRPNPEDYNGNTETMAYVWNTGHTYYGSFLAIVDPEPLARLWAGEKVMLQPGQLRFAEDGSVAA